MKHKGFTLVELLVVISVIALLLSVLMPALSRAREAAKVVSCAANSRQIATIISIYQASNDGYVPVLINRYASYLSWKVPAKSLYLSLALRDYIGGPKLPNEPLWDTNQTWNHQSEPYITYCKEYLPKFFVCPFNRQKKWVDDTYIPERLSINGSEVYSWRYRGYTDCYTAVSMELKKGPNNYLPFSGNPLTEQPAPKYGTLVWHSLYAMGLGGNPGMRWRQLGKYLEERPIRWDKAALRRIKTASLSNAAILQCERGQFLSTSGSWGNTFSGVFNYGSHKKGTGGTNVTFC